MLTFRDISHITDIAKLNAENRLISYISSCLSHEILSPIKCTIQILDSVKK